MWGAVARAGVRREVTAGTIGSAVDANELVVVVVDGGVRWGAGARAGGGRDGKG